MPPRKYHVTDAELSVLQVLWDRGQQTTRQITDQLYPDGSTAQYYTVQKLLERLESRNCVLRNRDQRIHKFTAAIDRETLIQERLRDLSDSLCDGSIAPMLSGLVQLRRWTEAEQAELRKLLDESTEEEQ